MSKVTGQRKSDFLQEDRRLFFIVLFITALHSAQLSVQEIPVGHFLVAS